MSQLPARIRCDRCDISDAEYFGKPPDGWACLQITYHTSPGKPGELCRDLCPGCLDELQAAGGLDLHQWEPA